MSGVTKDVVGDVFYGLSREFHELMKEKGWHDSGRELPEEIVLMHSELSESLEEYRVHGLDTERFIYFNHDSDKPDKPEGIAVEFADVIYRIFDAAAKYELPLAEALLLKHEYNKTRPYRHGGKKA